MLTIKALQNNYLASQTDLIIYSDGYKNIGMKDKVDSVRQFLRSVDGFKSIQIIESPLNKGLANSIITGVTEVVNKYGKVIVLEDDLITSKNFLDYMNQALDFYEKYEQVLSISGFSFADCVPDDYNYDATFGYRASSWGWGTWKPKWEKVDWQVSDYKKFRTNPIQIFKFNKAGSDLSLMLKRQMKGKINSWAIRFCYHQFKYGLVDVYPKISKVNNIGFGDGAEHCDVKDFDDLIDQTECRIFVFSSKVVVNQKINDRFVSYNSILKRLKRKFNRFLTKQ